MTLFVEDESGRWILRGRRSGGELLWGMGAAATEGPEGLLGALGNPVVTEGRDL